MIQLSCASADALRAAVKRIERLRNAHARDHLSSPSAGSLLFSLDVSVRCFGRKSRGVIFGAKIHPDRDPSNNFLSLNRSRKRQTGMARNSCHRYLCRGAFARRVTHKFTINYRALEVSGAERVRGVRMNSNRSQKTTQKLIHSHIGRLSHSPIPWSDLQPTIFSFPPPSLAVRESRASRLLQNFCY